MKLFASIKSAISSKILQYLLIVSTCYSPAISANIIYVYLSETLPDYIFVGLEQARLFNPKTNIFLIANESALSQCRASLNKHAIIAIAAEHLLPSEAHRKFNSTSTLDTHSYGGLWRKSTERFFYIQELIALYNLKSTVHVEADVMIYFDLEEMREALSCYKGIGAVFDCDYRCIPSIIYIPNEKAMSHMIDFITQNASKGLFDMHIIGEYRNTYPAEHIDNLPLIMPEYIQDHTLINSLGKTTSRPSSYCHNIEHFKSIFDAAALGQYLGGTSPVHGTPTPGFISETCLFNPSHLIYEWRTDGQGRKVPFGIYNGHAYRINNLHIHSKQLHFFKS